MDLNVEWADLRHFSVPNNIRFLTQTMIRIKSTKWTCHVHARKQLMGIKVILMSIGIRITFLSLSTMALTWIACSITQMMAHNS